MRRWRRPASAMLVVLALAGAGGAVAVALGDGPSRPAAAPRAPSRADDPRARGRFVVECGWSHAAADDPIVDPGSSRHAHLHDFFGNTGTDAHSTPRSLARGETTCRQRLDRAAYWSPALLDPRGDPVRPTGSTAYYRVGPATPPAEVEPFPFGLVMIAGDAHAAGPQDADVAGWRCGRSLEASPLPPVCTDGVHLRLRVTFPSCWDGTSLDAADHRSHMAYAGTGGCPRTHPVAVPELTFEVEYPLTGDISRYTLASGGLHTGHADFMNAWDATKLAAEVAGCLRRDLVCTITEG